MKKILMVGNTDFSIYNYRKELVEKLINENYEVYVMAPKSNYFNELLQLGCKFYNINLSSYSINPFFEIKTIIDIYYKIKKIKPDIILTYTIKPNSYVGFISRILKIPYIVNITGLGIAIENGGILQKISLFILKIGIKKANTIFFQNQDNYNFLTNKFHNSELSNLIPGSGVNLIEHPFVEYPPIENNIIHFLFIGRIIKSKGIEELFDLILYLEKKYKTNFHFHICGSNSEDYKEKFSKICQFENVTYHGKVKNIHSFIADSHAVILPTHHEGMANVLLEAAATGRPVLASNIPGCIETFDENISGLSFEVKNSKSLIATVEKFINLSFEDKKKMGIKGREKIEKEFNREIITNLYFSKIKKMLQNK